MKNFFKNIDSRWKEYALAGCTCILFFLILTSLGKIFGIIGSFLSIFKTVIIGAVIAYIINPLAMFFEHKLFTAMKKEKTKWALSVIAAFLIIILLLILLGMVVIPQMLSNVASLFGDMDTHVENLVAFANKLGGSIGPYVQDFVSSFTSDTGALSKILNYIKENSSAIIAATSNVGSSVANLIIGVIFALYFLLSKETIKAQLARLMQLTVSKLNYINIMDLLKKFHLIFSKYIVFELIDALIIGVCNYIFMKLTRMPDAAFISLIAGVTNLIPTFGPIIGAVIGAFVLILVQPQSILPFLIFTIFIQTMDGYVIKPKLFGNALNVPGVIILVSIIVFGKLMGITGMLIAIPLAAIIVYIYTDLLIPYLELKQDLKDFKHD